MTYDIVYYINGKKLIRFDGYETKEEALECAEYCSIGYDIKHTVEEHVVPKPTAKSILVKGLALAAEMLLVAVVEGYGRRD